MLPTLIYAVPMMIGWLILANQPPTIANLLVGYAFGFAITLLIRANSSIESEERPIQLKNLPAQLRALLNYSISLWWEILLSGIDVARRVLPREMNIDPAIHVISTCDEQCNPLVAALSAHAITITPGSFVIDFDDDRFPYKMVVHVLDTNQYPAEKLESDQRARVDTMRQILGISGEPWAVVVE